MKIDLKGIHAIQMAEARLQRKDKVNSDLPPGHPALRGIAAQQQKMSERFGEDHMASPAKRGRKAEKVKVSKTKSAATEAEEKAKKEIIADTLSKIEQLDALVRIVFEQASKGVEAFGDDQRTCLAFSRISKAAVSTHLGMKDGCNHLYRKMKEDK